MGVDWVKDLIDEWVQTNRVGNIQVNFFKGSVPNVEVRLSLKPPKTVTPPKEGGEV